MLDGWQLAAQGLVQQGGQQVVEAHKELFGPAEMHFSQVFF